MHIVHDRFQFRLENIIAIDLHNRRSPRVIADFIGTGHLVDDAMFLDILLGTQSFHKLGSSSERAVGTGTDGDMDTVPILLRIVHTGPPDYFSPSSIWEISIGIKAFG
jgi:hypothetical protein